MTASLYAATVPAYLQTLSAMAGLLDKAAAHCQAQGLPESEITSAALAPDMWDFAKQIRAVALHSGAALEGAIAGELAPDLADPPQSFAGLRQLIDTAIAKAKAVTPAEIDALPGRDTVLRFGTRRMDFEASDFLLSFALPNFYFHASAAYCIARMRGVPLSKGDFLGAVRMKAPAAA